MKCSTQRSKGMQRATHVLGVIYERGILLSCPGSGHQGLCCSDGMQAHIPTMVVLLQFLKGISVLILVFGLPAVLSPPEAAVAMYAQQFIEVSLCTASCECSAAHRACHAYAAALLEVQLVSCSP